MDGTSDAEQLSRHPSRARSTCLGRNAANVCGQRISQYLQEARGLSRLMAGVCLAPLGVLIAAASQLIGWLVATRVPGGRAPLAIFGTAAGARRCCLVVARTNHIIAGSVLFGVFLGIVIAPVTNTAVSGMPYATAELATSLPSPARQTGTALGVAISGTIVGPILGGGPTAFTHAEHDLSWTMLARSAPAS